MNELTPSGRVVLVTGANGDIGRAIARAFLQDRDVRSVWLGVHERRDAAEALQSEHATRGFLISIDVTRPEAWQAAVARITSEHGRLDVLVHNAGYHDDALLAQMPASSWTGVLETNLTAVFHGCQAALPTMIAQRFGRIVNVASLSAWAAPAGQTNYAAAKAGVLALTQSLAKEVARLGITVNAVCPGYIESAATANLSEEARRGALQRVPMRRFGRPEEVAAAVRFLACAEAGYITGSALKIDGGIL